MYSSVVIDHRRRQLPGCASGELTTCTARSENRGLEGHGAELIRYTIIGNSLIMMPQRCRRCWLIA